MDPLSDVTKVLTGVLAERDDEIMALECADHEPTRCVLGPSRDRQDLHGRRAVPDPRGYGVVHSAPPPTDGG
jgi:hypothetical protein